MRRACSGRRALLDGRAGSRCGAGGTPVCGAVQLLWKSPPQWKSTSTRAAPSCRERQPPVAPVTMQPHVVCWRACSVTGEVPQGVWRAAACIGACASVVRGTGGAVGRGSGRTILSHGAGVLRVACGPMAPAAHLCTRFMSHLHPTPSRLPYSAAARRRAAATRSEPPIVVAVSYFGDSIGSDIISYCD